MKTIANYLWLTMIVVACFPLSVFGESADELINRLRNQFTCGDGCGEIMIAKVEGYGIPQEIDVRRLITDKEKEYVWAKITGSGERSGEIYLSSFDPTSKDNRPDQYFYDPEQRKVRHLRKSPWNEVLNFINFWFLDARGWLSPTYNQWSFGEREVLIGEPKIRLPRITLQWMMKEGTPLITEILLQWSLREKRKIRFEDYQPIRGKWRPSLIEISIPGTDNITFIRVLQVTFREGEVDNNVFHYSRLGENARPPLSEGGKEIAKLEFTSP